ncbi:MAG: ribosome silencing factor [Bacteroidia bacterium]
MTRVALDARALSEVAIHGLQEIKGKEILRMDLRKIGSAVSDYFILCTGTSDKHVQALADAVIEAMRAVGERPISKEGMNKGEWILLDFVDVVVHIFQRDTRAFYRLEDLWGDADCERLPDL